MKRLKGEVISFLPFSLHLFLYTSSSMDNSMLSASFSAIYGVGIVAVLAIGACVFLAYIKKSSQAANKEQVNEEQQQPIKSPKQRSMI